MQAALFFFLLRPDTILRSLISKMIEFVNLPEPLKNTYLYKSLIAQKWRMKTNLFLCRLQKVSSGLGTTKAGMLPSHNIRSKIRYIKRTKLGDIFCILIFGKGVAPFLRIKITLKF